MNKEKQTELVDKRISPRWLRMMSAVIVALVFGVLMRATVVMAAPVTVGLSQSAPEHDGDDDFSRYGVIASRPEGNVGTWVIGDKSYAVNESTELEGVLDVGACVEVKAQQGEPIVALKIEAKDAFKCDGDDDDNDDDDGGNGGGGDEFIRRYGIVVTRPVESVGTWVIDSKSYSVTETTVLEGALDTGACVEVKTTQGEPTVAIKIEGKDAFNCDGDDDDDDDNGNGGGGDEFFSRYGTIITRSVESTGTWVIGSKSYTVTESTVLEGALDAGVCVEVKVLKSDPTVAVKIEAKEAFKCDGDDDDDDDDNGGHHGGDDDFERYGRLESRPEGKVGVWIIGGKSYTATESTELDQDHGSLVVGVCTKVHLLVGDPTVAREIESEADYKCSGRENDDDDSASGKLYGVIEQLPADLQNGTWVIGGLSFVVSPTTELVSKSGTFTVGLTVKVDFTTNMSDTNFAKRIEIKFGQENPCRRGGDDHHGGHGGDDVNHNGGGDDDRNYGYCPGQEGKTFGLINGRPEGSLIGEWMIGGVPYITTAATKFHHDDDFLAGERVKVEYVVLSDNMRRITQIKESDDNGGVSNPNNSLIVGYVDAKPEAFVGSWTINGAPFVAVSSTVFIERGSLFAVGAYVVVEYEIVNDQREIIKILTYVPPGAGDDNASGRLEVIGGVKVAGVDTTLQDGEIWTVDGVDYIVSAATQLVDGGNDFAPGAQVAVNSYTENGQRYATMIRAQAGVMYIPMTLK